MQFKAKMHGFSTKMHGFETAQNNLLTISEAADFLGVSIDTIKRWEKKGKIPKAGRTNENGWRKFDKNILLGLKKKKISFPKPEPIVTPIYPLKKILTASFLALFILLEIGTIIIKFTPPGNLLAEKVKFNLEKSLISVLPKNLQESFYKQEILGETIPTPTPLVGAIHESPVPTYVSYQPPPPIPIGDNLLINSSFEAGNLWSNPQSWDYLGSSTNSNTTVANSAVRTGNLALYFFDQNANYNNKKTLGISQAQTTTSQNRTYTISVFVKTINLVGSPTLRIGFLGGSSKDKFADYVIASGSEAIPWVPYTFTYENALVGKYSFIEVLDYEGGEIYLDDAGLYTTTASWNYSWYYSYLTSQSNLSIGDNSIIVSQTGFLYPRTGYSGSLGTSEHRFGSIFVNGFSVNKEQTSVDKDLSVGHALNVTGLTTLNGGLQVNSAATISGNLVMGANILPDTTNSRSLGSSSRYWKEIFVQSITSSGAVTINGTISSNLNPSATSTYDLGSNTLYWDDLYVNNIHGGGTYQGWWQRNSQALSPTNITDDLLLGATATSSALVKFGGTTNAVSWFNTGGNVGIGSTAPTAKLHIVGNADDEQLIVQGYSTQTTNLQEWKQSDGTVKGAFSNAGRLAVGTNSFSDVLVGTAMLKAQEGNVRLSVTNYDNDAYGWFLLATANTTGYGALVSEGNYVSYGSVTSHPVSIRTSNLDRLVLTSGGNVGLGGSITNLSTLAGASMVIKSGNVGIGTTSPAGALHVVGSCVTGDTLLSIRRRRRRRKNESDPDYDPFDDGYDYFMERIDHILPEDEVLSLNEETGEFEYHKIKGLLNMGGQETYRLKTESGRYIETTANHPYLVREPLMPEKAPVFAFVDETGITLDPHQPRLGVGALILERDELEINKELRDIFLAAVKALGQTEELFEFKFKYITPNSLPYYKKLIAVMNKYQNSWRFVSAFEERANHNFWHQYLSLIKTVLAKSKDRIVILADYLNKPKKSTQNLNDLNVKTTVVKSLQIESQGTVLLQMADVLLGALAYKASGGKDVYKNEVATAVDKLLKQKGTGIDPIYAAPIGSIAPEGTVVKRSCEATEGLLLRWTKVSQLLVGNEIAVMKSNIDYPDPEDAGLAGLETELRFEKIVSIKKTGRKQVYDIEVEGTHNFVAGHLLDRKTGKALSLRKEQRILKETKGNITSYEFESSWNENPLEFGGIVAHNTYIMSGNVGIGTTSPASALDVNGTTWLRGTGTSGLFVNSSGNVGIGTTIPANALDVNGAIAVGTYAGLANALPAAAANGLAISGNVGIGTTAPAGALHVVGSCVTDDTLLKRKRRRKRRVGARRDAPDDWEEYWEDVRIDEINEGDEILTLDENTGKFVESRVNRILNMGTQKVFRLVTSSGKMIQTTANHPYLVLENPKNKTSENFEIDQSVRIEDISKDTFVSIANKNHTFILKIDKNIKSRLKKKYSQKPKAFGSEILTNAIIHLLKYHKITPNKLDIDTEYPGYEKSMTKKILRFFPNTDINFKSIGKDTLAHISANALGGTKKKQKKTGANSSLIGGLASELLHPEFTGIRSPRSLLSKEDSTTNWIKVKYLKKGATIATIDGWEKISALYEVSFKQTYDIEVENTHNFVGNGIIAHNTYISGNVGIGTTGPGAKLEIVGSADTKQLIIKANSTQANTNPLIQLQDSSGTALMSIHSNNVLNSFIGVGAGDAITTGTYNIFMGNNAGGSATTDNNNVAIGTEALATMNTSSQGANVAIGRNALQYLTTGFHNVAVGVGAGQNTTIGTYNLALGGNALASNQDGAANAAIGFMALNSNTSGQQNIGIGSDTGRYNQTGSYNTNIGGGAGTGVDSNSNSNNTFIGYQAGYAVTTGSNNLIFGYKAGNNLTTGANNIVIGYDIDLPTATSANTLNIGNLIFATGVDGTGTTLSSGNVGIGTTGPNDILEISKSASGTIGANIILNNPSNSVNAGSAITFRHPNNTGAYNGPYIRSFHINGTPGQEQDDLGFAVMKAGTPTLSMYILNSGNVGIGTTGPSKKLEIAGAKNTSTLRLTSTTDDASWSLTDYFGSLEFYSLDTSGVGPKIQGAIRSINDDSGGNGSTSGLGFFTSGTGEDALEKVRITNAGKVGIGIAIPSGMLDVQGSKTSGSELFRVHDKTSTAQGVGGAIAFAGRSGIDNTEYVQAIIQGYKETASANLASAITFKTAAVGGSLSEWMRIDSSGNVGIGTTAPASLLDVNGTAWLRGTGTSGLFVNSSGNVGIGTTIPANALDVNGAVAIGTYAGLANALPAAAANGLAISGNLGIGTTGPSDKLYVSGGRISQSPGTDVISSYLQTNASNAAASTNLTPGLVVYSSGSGHYGIDLGYNGVYRTRMFTSADISFAKVAVTSPVQSDFTELMVIKNSGNVGIGTTNPVQKLHVEGQCITGDTLLKRRRRRKGKNGQWIDEWEDIRIDQIDEGDEILTLNEQTGLFETQKVKKLLEMGIKEIYRLTTAAGKTIRTTANHPYLTLTDKKPAFAFIDEAGVGKAPDQPVFGVAAFYTSDSLELNRKLHNIFTGAVSAYSTNESRFEFKFNAVTKDNLRFFKAIVLALSKDNSWSFTTVLTKKDQKWNYWNSYLQILPRLLAKAPFAKLTVVADYLAKPKAAKKDLATINKLAKVTHLLQLESQGSLLLQVADILLGALHFEERQKELGLTSGKEAKIKLAKMVKVLLAKKITAIECLHAVESNLPQILPAVKRQKWTKVKDLSVGAIIATVDGWEKIAKIKKLPAEKVYDIEVENTHNFVGNGIIAHNTYISGNVGIGTTGPSTVLDVYIPTTAYNNESGGLRLTYSGDTTERLYMGWDNTVGTYGSAFIQSVKSGTAWTPLLLNAVGGNVGIAGVNPNQKLDIFGSQAGSSVGVENLFQLTRPTQNGVSYPQAATFALGRYTTPTDYSPNTRLDILLKNNSSSNIYGDTVVMSLQSSGNVGIGTTAPASLLDVNGTAWLRGTGTSGLFVNSSGNIGIGKTNPAYNLEVNGTLGVGSTAYFANPVGIGTTAPGYLLQVGAAGDGTEARANAWNALSDIRFKENITPITDALTKVLKLNGVSFNWESNGKASMGLIAQDVEKIFPEIVSSDQNGLLSLNYGALSGSIIEAIKEQQIKIDDIKNNVGLTVSVSPTPSATPIINSQLSIINSLVAKGKAIFENLTEFLGSVIFHSTVAFKDRVTFEDHDMAGFAEISEGQRKVDVIFEKEFSESPVVTANLIWDLDPNSSSVADKIDGYFIPSWKYVVTGLSPKGFSIILEDKAVVNLKFSWNAAPIKGAKTIKSISTPNLGVSATPINDAPSGTSPTPTETPTITPEITPVVTPSSTPTQTPTQDVPSGTSPSPTP